MIEQMFYPWLQRTFMNRSENPSRTLKQERTLRRLNGMRAQRSLLTTTARTAAMVGLATLLILVLLPAVLAAQPAGS
jgi:hypothetical protein